MKAGFDRLSGALHPVRYDSAMADPADTGPGTFSRPAYVIVGDSLRSTWTEATARPVGIGFILKMALAILISVPLLLLFLLLVIGAIAFGAAVLIVSWAWGAIRNLLPQPADRSGRENVRVIQRSR